VRVSIGLDAESIYRHEQLEKPRRVFFDLKGARTTAPLQDAVLKFDDDVVREIRLGRHPQNTTRVVMDMEAVEAYSVFTLYNPFRLVIDFKRAASAAKPAAPAATTGLTAALPGTRAPAIAPAVDEKPIPAAKEPVPLVSRPAAAPATVSPTSPSANANGQFSLARQLGLGISRIVLDAGHGGHDPGARGNGMNEAELVLDVTLRLRDLLEKQPGIEVTLTRDSDEFIQLEERTAIANRTGADLFLSGHLHVSHIGHTAERYQIAGHSALVVQAGTVSTRSRGEQPSFNVLRIQRPEISVARMVWDQSVPWARSGDASKRLRSRVGKRRVLQR